MDRGAAILLGSQGIGGMGWVLPFSRGRFYGDFEGRGVDFPRWSLIFGLIWGYGRRWRCRF